MWCSWARGQVNYDKGPRGLVCRPRWQSFLQLEAQAPKPNVFESASGVWHEDRASPGDALERGGKLSAGATSVTVRWRRCAPAFAWRLGFRRTVTEVAQPRCAARAQHPDCRQHRRYLSYSALAAMAFRCAAATSRNWMCATPPAAAAKPRNWMCAAPLARTPSVFFSLGLTPVYICIASTRP